jgi:hypothetical protein
LAAQSITFLLTLHSANMQITKEFLEAEISDLQNEVRKAEIFLLQAQATISAYQMLIRRLDAPEVVETTETGEHNG